MDDVVAVAVDLDSGETAFIVTWGRIQAKVDPTPLEALVLRHAAGFAVTGSPVRARVCDSLQEARDARYFFEAIIHFVQKPIPFGADYEEWRDHIAAEMENGRELYFLGSPNAL